MPSFILTFLLCWSIAYKICIILYAMFESSSQNEIFGALGSWEKLEEQYDPEIVKQKEGTCVAAVGEMLATYHGLETSQDEIIEHIGSWTTSSRLARFLNSKERRNNIQWKGGFFDPANFRFIEAVTKELKVWAVFLRDGETVGHAVLVYGIDKRGLILIKDPYDQQCYKMRVEELYRVLSEFVLAVAR